MATIIGARSSDRRSFDHLFFTAAAAGVLLLVFAGFARTYYLSGLLAAPSRVPEMGAVLHLHGAAFTLWILLMAAQPALIAAGRVRLHVALGSAGAVLALAVWLLGNLAAVQAIRTGYAEVGDPHALYAVTFFSMQAFAISVALGFLWRRRAETHKRLMLLSNAAILEAAVGRLPSDWVVATAPVSFYLGADLVILAGILYDRWSRGRVHAVWLWGGGALVASQVLRIAIMQTDAWFGFARWAARLA